MSPVSELGDRSGVTVLMGTYNGAQYLSAQLASIASQCIDVIDIVVSDDGSDDDTPLILQNWKEKWRKGTFEILSGPRQGFSENFRFLLARGKWEQPYVAMSDQDDIWDPDKLVCAIANLSALPQKPALYCSRTRYVDEDGQFVGLSPWFRRTPSFANALVQSLAGANTMVMNTQAANLVSRACAALPFVAHDWFIYMVVSGANGLVIYDPDPHIDYRQHGGNLIGANTGWRARFARIKGIISGTYSEWNELNLKALAANRALLSFESQNTLSRFESARKHGVFRGCLPFCRAGLYRQTWASTLALWIAFLFNKL